MNLHLDFILYTSFGIFPNPYINRVMIRNPKDFYGRKREVARLYARIGATRPQSVSVTGERRIGKSSLLWYLMQPENAQRYLSDPDQVIFIFLDFQENREMKVEDFCSALLEPLSKRIPDIHPDGGYDALLSAVQHLDSGGFKLIVLLDEFETVTQNPDFDGRFYAFLRSLANRYDVAYITSSRVPLQYLCHSKQISDSPFFNIFSSMHLSGLTEGEALELIREPSQAAGVPLEPYADFLLDIGGTYPFFLQIACSASFEYMQFGDPLDEFGREDIKENFLEEAEPHFLYIWEKMEEIEQQLVRSIMAGKPMGPRERGTLRNLLQQGYILESKERGAKGKQYRLFSSLFAQWLEDMPQGSTAPKGEYAPEAIVVIDICGSTPIANRYGAHRLRALYDELEGIATEVAGRFRDRYRRTTGDGILLTFHTVMDAVNASLEIQRRVHEHNAVAEESHRIPVRLSINFGETLTDTEDRRYGDAVNMAFRVEGLSDKSLPDQDYVLVTEHVARELGSVPGISCREVGTFELRGLTGLHRVYQLVQSD